MVSGGGTFRDLFLSTAAFVTKDTAGIYGPMPPAMATRPRRWPSTPTKPPGFLTRVAFLSTFSHFDATSPILVARSSPGVSSPSRPVLPTSSS